MIEVIRKCGPPPDAPVLVFAESWDKYNRWIINGDCPQDWLGRTKYVNCHYPVGMFGIPAFFYVVMDALSAECHSYVRVADAHGTVKRVG